MRENNGFAKFCQVRNGFFPLLGRFFEVFLVRNPTMWPGWRVLFALSQADPVAP
jgi:hypothetical protein